MANEINRRLLGSVATVAELQAQLQDEEKQLGMQVLRIGVVETNPLIKAGASDSANFADVIANIDADQLPSVTVAPVDAEIAADPDRFKAFYETLLQSNTIFENTIVLIKGELQHVFLMRPGVSAADREVAGEPMEDIESAGEKHRVKASSFADPVDVEAFQKCKANGGTDQHCFKVGDNGIGFMGDDCTTSTPMCALPPEVWLKKWGSKSAARLKPVNVTISGRTVKCLMGDTMPHLANITNGAGIDLSPAAVEAFGLKPPLMIDAEWSWA